VSYLVLWSDFALDRLTEFLDFIAQDNPSAARRVVQDLFDRVQALADQPWLGHRLSDAAHTSMRRLVVGAYVLVYQVDEPAQTIWILAARHSRQRPFPEEGRSGR